MSIRIFLADDHHVVREGLERFIELGGDMRVVGQSDSLRGVRTGDFSHVDVLVLDLQFSDGNALEVLGQLVDKFPTLAILVFSMVHDPDVILRCLRLGARGFVDKNEPATAVLSAIQAIRSGGRRLPETLVEFMTAQQIDLLREPHEDLSKRELEVFRALVRGERPTDIAASLGLTVSTVTVYVHRIKQKLGVSTIGQVIAYAHRMGVA